MPLFKYLLLSQLNQRIILKIVSCFSKVINRERVCRAWVLHLPNMHLKGLENQ